MAAAAARPRRWTGDDMLPHGETAKAAAARLGRWTGGAVIPRGETALANSHW